MTESIKKQALHAGVLIAAILGTVLAVFAVFMGNDPVVTPQQETVVSTKTTETELNAVKATVNEGGTVVSYPGQTGQTALAILKEVAETETEESSFGEFVTTINGVEGNGPKYWLFYVDGEAATVGASEYVTSDGESIEWRLE